MENRVVITGLGVVAPNGVGLTDFTEAIKNGTSGVEFFPHLKELGFSCCIGGKPKVSEEKKREYLTELQLRDFNSSGILYGCMAGMDAWKDAGFSITDTTDYDSGTIFGAGTSGIERFREAIYKLDDLQVRRLGSTVVAQTMASGVSAYLGGILGLGNQVTTNSSACTTGTIETLNIKSKLFNIGNNAELQSENLRNQLLKQYSQANGLEFDKLKIEKIENGIPRLFYDEKDLGLAISLTHCGEFGGYSIRN